MDFKTAKLLASPRYIGPTIAVILLTCGGMAYVWKQYQNLRDAREQFEIVQKDFYEAKSAFEKNRATVTIELAERKAELEKRYFIVSQLEGSHEEQLQALQKKESQYETAYATLQQAQLDVSDAEIRKEAEAKLQKLMSDFSALGVDLNAPIACNDLAAGVRFNSAKSKFYEARSVADAYGLTKRFESFFSQNGQHVYSACTTTPINFKN